MALLTGNYISLFAGAGGFDLGLKIACPETRCVCLVENEVNAAKVLAARNREGSFDDCPVWSDVRSFPCDIFRGRVAGIIGGFPCTDLSVAGRQAGIVDGEHSSLWFEYLRIIREVRPRWIVVENVPPVISFPAGGIVLGGLAESGFDAEWLSIRASDVGASHGRNRVFILADTTDDNGRRGIGGTETGTWHDGIGRRGFAVNESELGNPDIPRLEGWNERGDSAGERVAGEAGGELADTDGEPGNVHRRKFAGLRMSSRSGSEMGNTTGHDERRKPIAAMHGEGIKTGRSDHYGLPLFAPGPGATDLWKQILREHTYLSPAISEEEIESLIRDLDDGLAATLAGSRTDQLRCAGNGVVSLCAAAAITLLARRMKGTA